MIKTRVTRVVSIAVMLLLQGNSPAWALVFSGEASGYGISGFEILGPAPQLQIPETPTIAGIAPVPFVDNANLATSNFTSVFGVFTIAESDTGELDVNISSDVDGAVGNRSASADATVDNVSIQTVTQVVPPLVPVTLDFVLDVQATEIHSAADVSGEFGALAPSGTATLSGTSGANNDQASITVLGVEFLLDSNPLPHPASSFMITQAQVPSLEGQIEVRINEQILAGDGINDQSIEVNALRILIGTGMIKLPPNFTDAAWAGDIIVAHSEAALQANIIPEPSTLLLAALGLLGMTSRRWLAK